MPKGQAKHDSMVSVSHVRQLSSAQEMYCTYACTYVLLCMHNTLVHIAIPNIAATKDCISFDRTGALLQSKVRRGIIVLWKVLTGLGM